jgi:cytochrome c biogenesis protein
MSPVEFDGRAYYLSGVRESAAEPFRYLHIPVDANHSPGLFIKYNAMLYDDERVLSVVRQTTEQSFGQVQMDKPELRDEVIQSMMRLVALYRQGGFESIAAMVESSVPEAKREEVLNAYFKVLQTLLGELYLELLAAEGVDIEKGLGAEAGQFLDEALAAIGSLGSYASPFYLQLTAFDFVQASGLQIARAPGKNVVYFGFALLTAGVFLMFYVPNRRLWCWIDQQDGAGRVLLAGTGNRHQRDFKEEFERLCKQLDAHWKTS